MSAIGNLTEFLHTLELPEFMSRGVCAETDPEAFFPDKGDSTAAAKRVCAGCPVRAECLEYALQRGERYGVWGGTSERQRRAILAGRQAAEREAVA
ncbi:MAG: WhiB family transcriptional regulator [Steroidobacteraceae bacterium]